MASVKAMCHTGDKMIDYAEVVLQLQSGRKELESLLTNKEFKKAREQANSLIISLIDLKWWIDKQNDTNK
jgi:hypothetical protein